MTECHQRKWKPVRRRDVTGEGCSTDGKAPEPAFASGGVGVTSCAFPFSAGSLYAIPRSRVGVPYQLLLPPSRLHRGRSLALAFLLTCATIPHIRLIFLGFLPLRTNPDDEPRPRRRSIGVRFRGSSGRDSVSARGGPASGGGYPPANVVSSAGFTIRFSLGYVAQLGPATAGRVRPIGSTLDRARDFLPILFVHTPHHCGRVAQLVRAYGSHP